GILHQLDQQIHLFPEAYLPVLILLRASGWRISDVLNLRCDTCLVHTPSGWWLCGDIRKTNVLNHKVPISDDIAALVTTQRKWMAHLSPRMTMVYAKLLDPTLRRAWEEAFARGAVRIDAAGVPRPVDPAQLVNEQEIEWEHIRHHLDAVRLPNGYCFKPKKAH